MVESIRTLSSAFAIPAPPLPLHKICSRRPQRECCLKASVQPGFSLNQDKRMRPAVTWSRDPFPALGRRSTLQILVWILMCPWIAPKMVHAKSDTKSPTLSDDIPVYGHKVIKRIEHDPTAFTQGLEFDDQGYLVEGTGLYGQSRLFRGTLTDTNVEVKQTIDLEEKLFGEGLTILEDTIVQTTWRENVGLIFDKATLEPKGSFPYPYEGWGVSKFQGQLVTTDGTNIIRFWEIGTWKELKSVTVSDSKGEEVQFVLWKTYRGELLKLPLRLNELEMVEGELWANLWPTETVARIDPTTGRIKAWVDLRGLRAQASQAAQARGSGRIDVLNGIAYQPPTAATPARLLVTGKSWPLMFELDVGQLEILPQCLEGDGDGAQVCSAQGAEGFAEGGVGEKAKKKKKKKAKQGELFTASPAVLEGYPEPDFGI